MIVRDEEENIGECLKCVRECADEMIVVDTGSEDRTVVIAESLGAKVFHFPWCDDFAAARNESLRHATGDWVLWLDADDRISAENASILGRLKHVSPKDVVYCFEVVSISETGEKPPFMQMRLFPRRPEIRFENRVHESIGQSVLNAGLKVEYTNFRLEHMGYGESQGIREKLMRNKKLLELDLRDNPQKTSLRYQLAQTNAVLGDNPACIEELKKIMEIPKENQAQRFVYEHAPAEIADKYFLLGEIEQSLEWAEKALALNARNIVALYLKGEILLKTQGASKARPFFAEIAKGGFEPHSIPIDIPRYTQLAKERLSQLG